jgi:hypothetical protein
LYLCSITVTPRFRCPAAVRDVLRKPPGTRTPNLRIKSGDMTGVRTDWISTRPPMGMRHPAVCAAPAGVATTVKCHDGRRSGQQAKHAGE